jgi:hypothetical protein
VDERGSGGGEEMGKERRGESRGRNSNQPGVAARPTTGGPSRSPAPAPPGPLPRVCRGGLMGVSVGLHVARLLAAPGRGKATTRRQRIRFATTRGPWLH